MPIRQAPFTVRRFQRPIVRAFERGDDVVLSAPRGQGKSSLVAWLAHRKITPGDPLFSPDETFIVSQSLHQARRTTFKALRMMVNAAPDAADYRIANSRQEASITHKATGAAVHVLPASADSAQGLIGGSVLADEPGAWQLAGGQAVHDVLDHGQGKLDAPLQIAWIGTLAPRADNPMHWWHDLAHQETRPGLHVTLLQGRLDGWDTRPVLQRCNPLVWHFAESRAKLLEKRDKARLSSSARAAFLSYRLNIPSADTQTVVVTVEQWKRAIARAIPARAGRPVVGVDLGRDRAWSTAVGIWPDGTSAALAVGPGLPDLAQQERRDRVPRGTYQRLAEAGLLVTDGERRVPRPECLLERLRAWHPAVIICDRVRLPELLDAAAGLTIRPRVARWSEAASDIRALRALCDDGAVVCREGLPAAAASLA